MNEATRSYLKSLYKEHYFRRADEIEVPDEVDSREFGYIPFGGSMVRHLTFRSNGEAVAEMVRQGPSSAYCSNATYNNPALPMDEKGWRGAELIFDIDATDIPTSCKKSHDIWFCEKCHNAGKLPRPQSCPLCKGKIVQHHGTCEVCLEGAKEHTRRLKDFLTDDFGTSEGVIKTYFSGNRGYHVHVFDPRFYALDPVGRAEIASYIRGDSLPHLQTLASAFRRRRSTQGGASGWMRRMASYVDQRKEEYQGTIQKLVSESVAHNRALIDSSVTTDIHRVFRLAGTLHGETGMRKTLVKSLDAFDPFRDPVVLGGEPTRLRIGFCPRFSIMGGIFGPFKESTESIPAYAAVPILTRGFGEVAQ